VQKFCYGLAIALLAVTGLFLNMHESRAVPMNKSLSAFPQVVGEWRMIEDEEFTAGVLEQLKPTDYLSRIYADTRGELMQFYVGYHNGGEDAGEIHSPKHCLPGGGWSFGNSEHLTLDMGGGKQVTLLKTVLEKDGEMMRLLYWYQVMDESLTNEYRLKLASVVNSVLHGRKDASFVRFILPKYTGTQQEVDKGLGFIRTVYPELIRFLPS
jgi:EpsI family protein